MAAAWLRDRMSNSLQATTRENISVVPLKYDRAAEVRHVVGAWLQDGSIVEEIALRRGRKRVTTAAPQHARVHVADERVYGGIVMHHYGHFLFETLARAWFLKRSRPARAVWHILPDLPKLYRWQTEILSMLGLEVAPDDLILEPTRFAKLIIPQAGAELWTSFHPEQVEAMAIFPFRKPRAGRKLWLSRSRRTRKGSVQEEQTLEALLQQSGWQIMQPETLPVREQLAQLSDAEVVAGFDGSAFHTLMLGRDVQTKVAIVPRGAAHKISPTYGIIAEAKGFPQSILPARLAPVRGSGRGAVHRLENPGELVETLNSL